MFYDNFKDACERRGTNISTVLTELGRSSGNTGAWKAGKLPRLDVLMALSEYLHITIDELVYGPGNSPMEKENTQNIEPPLDSEWIEIISHIPLDRQQMCKDFLRTHMVVPEKYLDKKHA